GARVLDELVRFSNGANRWCFLWASRPKPRGGMVPQRRDGVGDWNGGGRPLSGPTPPNTGNDRSRSGWDAQSCRLSRTYILTRADGSCSHRNSYAATRDRESPMVLIQ